MTDTISSRLSSLDRPSVISVVWDIYFLNPGEGQLLLLGLMGTVDNGRDTVRKRNSIQRIVNENVQDDFATAKMVVVQKLFKPYYK